eukprot:m.893236 g.893236  ORF g.893236 m.893236 type:complete len:1699 (+) comp23658_c0_seq4:664-5760(+)
MHIVSCAVILLASRTTTAELLQYFEVHGTQSALGTGGLAVLESHNGSAPSILSDKCVNGSVDFSVRFTSHDIYTAAYQALLCIFITSADDISDVFSSAVQTLEMCRKIHAGILYTWYRLDNGTVQLNDIAAGRQDAGAMRLVVDNGMATGYFVMPDVGWIQLQDYQAGAAVQYNHTQELCHRVGVRLLPNYNTDMRAEVEYLNVEWDADRDGLDDAVEARVGTSVDNPDSDEDGCADGADAKPLDPLSAALIPLPMACNVSSCNYTVSFSNGSTVLRFFPTVHQQCTITWPHTALNTSGPVTLQTLNRYPVEEYLFDDEDVRIELAAGLLYTFSAANADFAPVVDSAIMSLLHVMSDDVLAVPLAPLAYDVEDDTIDLVWTITSASPPSELACTIGMPNATVGHVLQCTYDTTQCRAHNVSLVVADSGGNEAMVAFTVHLLGGDGPELVHNGAMEPTASGGRLEGWSQHTWAGLYEMGPSMQPTSALHNTSAQIEGLTAGRGGVYQQVVLGAHATYRLTFLVATVELVGNSYGATVDVTVLAPGLQIIETVRPAGSSNWTRGTLVFTVPFSARTATIVYFRMHGTGHAFFDDVHLTELLCYPPLSEPVLTMADTDPAMELLFVFPFVAETDGLLCGYCATPDDSNFSQSLPCVRCREAGHTGPTSAGAVAVSPQTLATFDVGDPMPFGLGTRNVYTTTSVFATRAVRLNDSYLDAYSSTGLASNWSQYDMLKVDVYNPAVDAVRFYVEIRDVYSTDYWSRVNWYTAAPPGRSTVVVPLRIFVGEKSITKEKRRLFLHAITRLVFATTLCHCVVVVDNVRLEAEPPYAHLFPTLLRLDAGTPTSPVEKGFTRLTAASWYRSRLGYGVEPSSQVVRADDREHPTNLLRDWIAFTDGGVRVDVPNGVYTVWTVIEDPGYWEYFPSFTRRAIYAGGSQVFEETQNFTEFQRKYFDHEDTEDLPGDDIFTRYIIHRYRPVRFNVTVTTGQLYVRFQTRDTYACTMSTLVIFPTHQHREGSEFLAELWAHMRQRYAYEYVEATRRPTGPTTDSTPPRSRPFEVFARLPAEPVRARDRPMSRDVDVWSSGLRIAVARGETRPLTFSVRPANGLPAGLVSVVAVRAEVPGAAAVVHTVRYKIQRLSESVYTADPHLLDPLRVPLALAPNVTRRFWIAVTGQTSGCGVGRVQLTFADGSTLAIPVHTTIRNFSLVDIPANITYGFLGLSPMLPSTPFTEAGALDRAVLLASLRRLRALGVTGLSGGLGGPRITGYSTAGPIEMDFAAADTTMDAVHAVFGNTSDKRLNSYFGMTLQGLSTSSATWSAASTGPAYGREYSTVLEDALTAIAEHAATRDGTWTRVVHNIADEPSDETSLTVLSVAELFKNATADAMTSVFTSITTNDTTRLAFAQDVDVVILNHHTAETIAQLRGVNPRVNVLLYNQASRYGSGLYVYRMLGHGVQGHYQFALSSPGSDPYYALDAREDDYSGLLMRSDGSVIETIGMWQMVQFAITDLRYGLTLDDAISRNHADTASAAVADAVAYRSQLLARMAVGHGGGIARVEMNSSTLRAVMGDLARHIDALVARQWTVDCSQLRPGGAVYTASTPAAADTTSTAATASQRVTTEAPQSERVDEGSASGTVLHTAVGVGLGVVVCLVLCVAVLLRQRRQRVQERCPLPASAGVASQCKVHNPIFEPELVASQDL